jgi:hypothetical protein
MNNTKKDKYLRKNRHDKNSKHKYKNKTRKVQRGGQPDSVNTKEISLEEVEKLKELADDSNQMKKKRFPMVKELIRKFKAWAIDKFTPGTTDSMKKLEELSKTEESIEHYENNEPVNNSISQSITEFKEILTGILKERLSELQKINSSTNNDELQKKIDGIDSMLKQIQQINEEKFTKKSKIPFESSKEILEKPSITQRFKQGFSNMRKTVKNAATSAKGAVTSRFSRKKNVNEDSQGIELQGLKNSNQEESAEPTSTDSTEENKTGNNEKSKTEPAASATASATTEPAPPEPPKTEPAAATPASATEPAPPEPPKTESAAPEPATPEPISQIGGNKTRKNRQYVREIKDNRTHLFNKEMEIINSIRNFKHGRTDNDNTKKQFIKAVKRS